MKIEVLLPLPLLSWRHLGSRTTIPLAMLFYELIHWVASVYMVAGVS